MRKNDITLLPYIEDYVKCKEQGQGNSVVEYLTKCDRVSE